jgi:predicted nucleic acid-binding protein
MPTSGNEVALDTNRWTGLFRGDADLAKFLARCEEVWIPYVVLGEIKAGFYGGTRPAHNEALLSRFVARETVAILLATRETAEHYARLFVQLKRAGTPIPDNDLWIAALVSEHDLTLITRDRHFEKLPQLRRADL